MKQSNRNPFVGQAVLPGDRILNPVPTTGKLRLGPGVDFAEDRVVATHLGVLNQTKSGKLWLARRQKRYTPAVDETVVGIVQDRTAEVFLVEIDASSHAELPITAFENVTKRNVPQLKPGDLVHARVTSAYPFTHPTLSCIDRQGRSADMGVLKEGSTVNVGTDFARSLLSTPLHPVLSQVGSKIKFEIVIGLNGRIWIDAQSTSHHIYVRHILSRCDGCDRETAARRCEQDLTQRL